MKKIFTPVLLIFAVLALYSFKPGDGYRDSFKNEGSIEASINGKPFVLRPDAFYRAILVNKPVPFAASADAARNRVATSLVFYGLDSVDANGRFFQENIAVEYTFSTQSNGEQTDASDVTFDVHYNLTDYYMLPEGNFFKVSKVDWSADKSSFVLSGKFDCTMHRRGYSNDLQPTVRIKGYINDIKVDVPPWIAARYNKVQAAEGN